MTLIFRGSPKYLQTPRNGYRINRSNNCRLIRYLHDKLYHRRRIPLLSDVRDFTASGRGGQSSDGEYDLHDIKVIDVVSSNSIWLIL